MAAVPSPRAGSGFVNLQKYLGASQGNPLAENVAAGISGAAQQAQQGTEQATKDFSQQVQGASYGSPEQQTQQQDILGRASGSTIPGQLPGVSQSDVDKYQSFTGATYKGPQDLGAQGVQLQGQAQQAQQLGQAVGSEAGRQQLLQRFVGAPQYTQGQRRLDQLVLGKAPQGQLQAAQRQTMGAQQDVMRQLAAAKAQAQQAQAQTQQFATKAQQDVNTARTNAYNKIYDPATGELAQATSAYQPALGQAKQALGVTNLTPELANQYGLNQGYTYGVKPSDYLQQGAPPTASSVSSTQEQAALNALQQISGQPTTQFTPGAAGTYQGGNVTVTPQFKEAEQKAGTEYANIMYNKNTLAPGILQSLVPLSGQLGLKWDTYTPPPAGYKGLVAVEKTPGWYLTGDPRNPGGSIASAAALAQQDAKNTNGAMQPQANALNQLIGVINTKYGLPDQVPYGAAMKELPPVSRGPKTRPGTTGSNIRLLPG